MRIISITTKDDLIYIAIDYRQLTKLTLPIAITTYLITEPQVSLAASKADTALKPIIDTIKDFSKPICYGSMLWGWSKVMLGQKTQGYKQIRESALGFIGVQLTPMLFGIISDIGSSYS